MTESAQWAEIPWTKMRQICKGRPLALLPVGSTEAHGPHLPLNTDVIIAEAMAAAARRLLEQQQIAVVVLPAIAYTVTEFAAEFAGTISIRPQTILGLLSDIGASLQTQGFRALCFANGHLEPAHRQVLQQASEEITASGLPTIFPDYVRRRYASRLGAEFMSGACHAGRYETSIVLASRPELVDQPLAQQLPENPTSIGAAIQEGKRTFLEAGGPEAYFGAPAAATVDEGRTVLQTLAQIMLEQIQERLSKS